MNSVNSRSSVLVAVAITSLLAATPTRAQVTNAQLSPRSRNAQGADRRAASLSLGVFTLTRPDETNIDVCGVNMFLLRKGPDGWKIFQIAATSRTDGRRKIAK
jgi:hypothetical protein